MWQDRGAQDTDEGVTPRCLLLPPPSPGGSAGSEGGWGLGEVIWGFHAGARGGGEGDDREQSYLSPFLGSVFRSRWPLWRKSRRCVWAPRRDPSLGSWVRWTWMQTDCQPHYQHKQRKTAPSPTSQAKTFIPAVQCVPLIGNQGVGATEKVTLWRMKPGHDVIEMMSQK